MDLYNMPTAVGGTYILTRHESNSIKCLSDKFGMRRLYFLSLLYEQKKVRESICRHI